MPPQGPKRWKTQRLGEAFSFFEPPLPQGCRPATKANWPYLPQPEKDMATIPSKVKAGVRTTGTLLNPGHAVLLRPTKVKPATDHRLGGRLPIQIAIANGYFKSQFAIGFASCWSWGPPHAPRVQRSR